MRAKRILGGLATCAFGAYLMVDCAASAFEWGGDPNANGPVLTQSRVDVSSLDHGIRNNAATPAFCAALETTIEGQRKLNAASVGLTPADYRYLARLAKARHDEDC